MKLDLSTSAFKSASVILPVMDETYSLTKTVDKILQNSANDIGELIIAIGDKTRPESMATIDALQQRLGSLVIVHHQILPFAGGAIREAFELARGSHVILMASDLETNPNEIPKLIAAAKSHPNAIIATSRWLESGSFNGYSKTKLMANWIFQRLFSTLYGTNLTDMTFGYRLYPTKILQTIKWEELRHPFFFETIVKPLRLGVEIIEIPTTWEARSEGQSHNSFLRNFEYFPIGFKTRFASKDSILKSKTT